MVNDPILLLQWLDRSDSNREVHNAIRQVQAQGIVVRDVSTKAEAEREIAAWQAGNNNTQVLYIGTHGNANGLGIGPAPDQHWTWMELRDIVCRCMLTPVLWFGACKSACAAAAWSPFRPGKRPARWMVGYDGVTDAVQLEAALVQLIQLQDINTAIDIQAEAEVIRKAFSSDGLDFHLPIRVGTTCSYVRFEDVQKTVNMSLRDYLDLCPGCCD